jgi:hypothetical protein
MDYPIHFPGGVKLPAARTVTIAECVITGPGEISSVAPFPDGTTPGKGSWDLLALYGVIDFTVRNNTLTNGGDLGVAVLGVSGQGEILGNTIRGQFGDAISIVGGSGYVVADNQGEDNGRRTPLTPNNPASPAPIRLFGVADVRADRNAFTRPRGIVVDSTVQKVIVDGEEPAAPSPPPPAPPPPKLSLCESLKRQDAILQQKLRQLHARLAVDQQRGDAARVAEDQREIATAEQAQAAVQQQLADNGCDDLPPGGGVPPERPA